MVINERGTFVRIERADGRLVEFDPFETDIRLVPGAAYCYAKVAGVDDIHAIKFLRETYDLTLLQAQGVIATEANTTVGVVRARLATELESVLT